LGSEMNDTVEIVLNGDARLVSAGISVEDLVQQVGLKAGQVAVEVNREIIRRSDWQRCLLRQGDEVEIVHFVGGGLSYAGEE
jgi:thiamine biosynthesis protein ThiS